MALSAVRACVTLLAESVAQLPCELYRRGANGGRERATDHPVYDLIHSQPNKKDTSFEYFEQQQGLLGLEGNCYSIIDRDGKGYRVNWTARAARAAGTSRCTSGCSSCCRYVCAGIDGTIQKSFESRCKFCRE
ncbi:phage portal protein [Citrobacter sp. Cf116]|nr:phage portal protein [Citrobacter sp. Cf116]MDM3347253.1 phage portal protein [Citrobacter sp. Cf116]